MEPVPNINTVFIASRPLLQFRGRMASHCCAFSQRHASAPKSAYNMSHARIAKQCMLYAMHLHFEEDFFRCHTGCLLNSCSVLAIIFNSRSKIKSEVSICHLRACDEGPGRSSIRAGPGHYLLEWIVGRSSLHLHNSVWQKKHMLSRLLLFILIISAGQEVHMPLFEL